MDVLDTSTKTTVASFALVVVLLGIVANFGASQMYNRYSYDNIMKVSEANRRDRLLSAEFEQAGYLDSLIEQQVKEKITAIAPSLAEEQARRLVDKFHRGELAKYAHEDGTAALPAPASQPKTTGAVDGRHSIPSPSPDSERRARIDNDPTNDPHVYKPYPNVTIFDAPDNATENFTNGNGRSM